MAGVTGLGGNRPLRWNAPAEAGAAGKKLTQRTAAAMSRRTRLAMQGIAVAETGHPITDRNLNRIMAHSPRDGLRYNENACVPGAQTERRGEATRPVRDLLTGESSPAAFCTSGFPA
jgi:hypothetical protein